GSAKGQETVSQKINVKEKTEVSVQQNSFEHYLQKVSTHLGQRIEVPPEKIPVGSYTANVRLQVNAMGKILSFQIMKSSGNRALDVYIRRSIEKIGKVPAPEKGFERVFSVNVSTTIYGQK
ncbi:MAG: TonB family protein, partial [Desulfovibrio sp.]|nr:TonB family protein [Desulfovibrio sp.]